jgi:hypothetical protein
LPRTTGMVTNLAFFFTSTMAFRPECWKHTRITTL